MVISILASYAVIHFGLLLYSFKYPDNSAEMWFLRLLLFGMIYDNTLQALGPMMIDGSWYLPLNYPRYVMHAGILPFMTLFALSLMSRASVELAAKQGFRVFCYLFTAVALVYGLWHEVMLLELAPTEAMDHRKLSSTSDVPPIATILTNMLVMIMAAMIWRTSGWRWLFLGALFIFIVNGAGATAEWGFLSGNMAEVVFVVAMLASYWHFFPRRA